MNIKTSQDFGELIKKKRKSLNFTQKDLAMTAGTGIRFIVELENGKPTCHINKALRVAQVLGIKISSVD